MLSFSTTMWKILFFTLFLYSCSFVNSTNELVEFFDSRVHPDVGLRVPALVAKYGYPLESYNAITEDKYILTLHRIPHGKNESMKETNKPVVFLMHGLLCSSADFVLMGPEKGLAFLLADMGYDVWMGNARGNTYSRKHVTLNPDINKKKFWDFSWHEIGIYDLPAMIDLVLEKSNQKQIFYIGHSQGTTSYFVMTSSRPEYNEKIRLMIAFAPVAFTKNIPNIAIQIIARFHKVLGWLTQMLGANEFLPSSEFLQLIGKTMCNDQSILQALCSNVLFLIAGYDSVQLNTTMIPVILSNTPAGAATKQLVHYGQGITSGKFQQYDYGLLNIFKYGQIHPPQYDVPKITSPIAMFYGKNDLLADEKDIDALKDKIKDHVILKYRVKHDKWNHLDFLWSIDIIPLLYERVFDLLERYSN